MPTVSLFQNGKQIVSDKAARLTLQQNFQLTEILRGELRAWLLEACPSYPEAAKRVSQLIDFPISQSHVARTNEMVAVWTPKRSLSMKKFVNTTQRLETIEAETTQRLADLTAEISHLRMLVHHLYYQLDAKPPAGQPEKASA